jgi:LacI family transcriptional regulator
MTRVTADDIAKIANVSRSTISRVVNDYPNVPEETRIRVMEIIRETGYVPHQQARSLAGVRSRILMLFVNNNNDYYADKIAGSTFFGPLTALIIDSANRRGYDAIVTQSAAPHSWERTRDLLFGRVASGAIFVGVANKDPRIRPFYQLPTVILDHKEIQNDNQGISPSTVNFDNRGGMEGAVRHVLERNCKKIAYITGTLGIYSGRERLTGFRQAMRRLDGAPLLEELILPGDFSEQSGYFGARQLMEKHQPDAIIAGDDECAIGVLKALEEMNISVPGDVSVAGFDDIELSRYIKPSLSTVCAPKRDISDKAVERLIDLVEGRPVQSNNIIIPTTFIPRES